MGQRRTLNQKRLTKKEVLEIIRTEGQIHEEYTKFFEEKYVTGRVKQDKVYELPGDRFLYVFDEDGLRGKGDIYPKDYFLRWKNKIEKIRKDYKNNRGSSVSHWFYYSKHKGDMLKHQEELLVELADHLKIDQNKLDNSYKSLDLVSLACSHLDYEFIFKNLYDNLVFYVGEVIKQRVNGKWGINNTHAGGEYPFISIGLERVQYMPINATWSALDGLDPIDFRKQAANEVRLNASNADYYRNMAGKSL
jgi:hypothetical protein